MMRQYLDIKEQNPDCLLLFRLGDFYELFFDDAITASKELEITLTGRDCGLSERAPMCGVPYHAVDGYVARLIEKGYKVAICEQLTDPRAGKGIVERGIVRIVTPGTVMEDAMLAQDNNNYILALYCGEDEIGLCVCDASTGAFSIGSLRGEKAQEQLFDELSRLRPSEVLLPKSMDRESPLFRQISGTYYATEYFDWAFELDAAKKNLLAHFKLASLEGHGVTDCGVRAAGALLYYINETQKSALAHINRIAVFHREDHMVLDATTRRNLELTQTIAPGGKKKHTLLGLLDRTRTSMGARLLKGWIEQPLQDADAINERLEAVDELRKSYMLRDALRESLGEVYDVERLCGKISFGSFNARDALALCKSLCVLPTIKENLALASSPMIESINQKIDDLADVHALLASSIADEPPVSIKEGGIIREGYNQQLDELRDISRNGRHALKDFELGEREKTGIKNLKVGFNKVFGYFIEVTKSNLAQVPYYYQRKQTISTGERFLTEDLQALQERILGADEKIVDLEYAIFTEIRAMLEGVLARMQTTARQLCALDALCSLAAVASDNGYCKPQVSAQEGRLEIIAGRHPVVERAIKDGFVPNDTFMDGDSNRLMIITGPNMAGKSTYMRQVALIVLMAHIGSFVPAQAARIPLTDRIFTRVGASDDLSGGQSTFMVEMNETANILNNATQRSLILMDEIGRGTSTYDGLSIAWAVVEYIADKQCVGAKTLFATHFHELSELQGQCDGVVNYRIAVKEVGDDIVFIRRIMQGGTDKSFGIQVARLAGVPQRVIDRAKEIHRGIEKADVVMRQTSREPANDGNVEEVLLAADAVLEQLRGIDINTTTPLEALAIVTQLQKHADEVDRIRHGKD